MINFKNVILILTTVFSIISCSKDDETPIVIPKPTLVGEWKYSKIGAINSQNQEELYPYENGCPSKNDFIQFSSTNNFIQTHHRTDCEAMVENSTFTNTNGTIHFYDQGVEASYYYKIISLTTTQLKVQQMATRSGRMAAGYDILLFTKK